MRKQKDDGYRMLAFKDRARVPLVSATAAITHGATPKSRGGRKAVGALFDARRRSSNLRPCRAITRLTRRRPWRVWR
jgi:hypothetical protein